MENKKYFYVSNGQPIGPFTYKELVELYRKGTIHRSTFVFEDGQTNWKTLNQMSELLKKIKSELGTDHLPPLPKLASEEGNSYYLGLPGRPAEGPFTILQVAEGIKTQKYTRQHFIFDSFVNDWVPLFTHPDFDRRHMTRLHANATPDDVVVPVPRKEIIKKLVFKAGVGLSLFGLLMTIVLSEPNTACFLGRGSSCFKLKQFEKGCDLKHGPSCFELSLLKKNLEEKLTFVSKACENQSSEACFELAAVDLQSNNIMRAQKHFEKSCELKLTKACNQLAVLLGDLNDMAGKKKVLEKSCQLNSGEGCAGLAQIYYDENNLPKAEEFFQKSCSQNIGLGCGGVANLLFLRGEVDLAEKFSRKACELKDAIGCGLLASFYKEMHNNVKAIEYFKIACDLKSGLSCYSLAELLKIQRAPASEINKAISMACKINNKYCKSTRE